VHLGADVPAPSVADPQPLVVSLGHLVARKRHADVMHAVAALPGVRYRVIGDGPERGALERLAAALGISDRVEFTGQLEPREALRSLRGAWAMALPSTEEAFGVAYIEAMAAGIPVIGCRGEPGPEEIAAVGEGIVLVEPRSTEGLTEALRELLGDRERRQALACGARLTVEREFTWERCGERTLAAYEAALA
jgi:teichuronic acid biosynthesis glycosyltransferase TuaC